MSQKITRREIMKKGVYVTPAILTLAAAPSFAKGGSGRAGESSSWSPKKDSSPKKESSPKKPHFPKKFYPKKP